MQILETLTYICTSNVNVNANDERILLLPFGLLVIRFEIVGNICSKDTKNTDFAENIVNV